MFPNYLHKRGHLLQDMLCGPHLVNTAPVILLCTTEVRSFRAADVTSVSVLRVLTLRRNIIFSAASSLLSCKILAFSLDKRLKSFCKSNVSAWSSVITSNGTRLLCWLSRTPDPVSQWIVQSRLINTSIPEALIFVICISVLSTV